MTCVCVCACVRVCWYVNTTESEQPKLEVGITASWPHTSYENLTITQ